MSNRRRRSRIQKEGDTEKTRTPLNLGLSGLTGESANAPPPQPAPAPHPMGAVDSSTFLALRDRLAGSAAATNEQPARAPVEIPVIQLGPGPAGDSVTATSPETPAPAEHRSEEQLASAPEEIQPEPDREPDGDVDPDERYRELFTAQRYGELLATVGDELKQGEAIVPRLWWIRAQLATGTLPLSLLAARCGTVAQSIEQALGLPFAHQRRHLAAVSALGEEIVGKLRQKKQSALADELEGSLRAMNAAAAAAPRPVPIAVQNRETAGTKRTGTSPAEPAREEERARGQAAYLGIAATLAAQAAAAKEMQRTAAPAPAEVRGSWSLKRAVFLCSAVVCGAAYLLLREPQHEPGSERFAHLDLPQIPAAGGGTLALKAPRLEPVSGVNELASIAYDIDQSRTATSGTNARLSTAPAQNIDIPPSAGQNTVRQPAKSERRSKDSISIDRPTEPAEVRRYEDNPDTPEDTAEFDFPPYRNSARAVDPNLNRAGGAASERTLTRFSEPRRYTIIAATRVMESASYWASSLGALDIGEEVKVEAQIGVWLKIRMENGRAAYILAQDARE